MVGVGLYSGPGVVGNPTLAGGLLLGSVLLGLAIFIWAFWSQRRRLKVLQKDISCCGQRGSCDGVQNVHKILLALFLLDAVHAAAGLVLGVCLIASPADPTVSIDAVFIVWFLSRWFTQALHLLVAFGSIVHLCLPLPQSTARMRVTAVWLVAFFLASVLGHIFLSRLFVFGVTSVIFMLAIAVVAKSAQNAPTLPASARRRPFLFLSVFTFLVTFLPAFVLQCLVFFSDAYTAAFTNTLFFTNVQLWADALLAHCVLKLLGEQEEPQRRPGLHVVTVNVIA